jgi:mono/diheme cytochrome c family protein
MTAPVSGQPPGGAAVPKRPWARRHPVAAALAVVFVLLGGAVLGLLWRGWHLDGTPPLRPAASPAAPSRPAPADPASDALVAQRAEGAYLARIGNCVACHTVAGRPLMSGGKALVTPFGTQFTSNLTPDADTGLGRWSEADFLRALRHGRSRDGRLLSPAFPYTRFNRLSDEDGRALWAYLRSVAPVRLAPPPSRLTWPADQPWALALWRGLYFWPDDPVPAAAAAGPADRGAYLVQGLAHCGACHDARNALGAARQPGALDGQALPGASWHAPSLRLAGEAGVQSWSEDEVVALLKTGQSPRGQANGPMAEVVQAGTQFLRDADLRAMAAYLRQLPLASPPPAALATATGPARPAGRTLYERHCADCHGAQGQGVAGFYVALAGNRLVTQSSPANLIRMLMDGGFEPATAANPRPYGMPPYGPLLGDAELADLLSYLRSAWGHQASAVSPVEVNRMRAGQR